MVGVLLAVGVIYHAVDMDLFAHVHGEDEREPASAEVGAGLDPANTQTQPFSMWSRPLFAWNKNIESHQDGILLTF